MSATDQQASLADVEVLAALERALGVTLDRISYLKWDAADPPTLEAAQAAGQFTAAARALVRAFEEGPVDTGDDALAIKTPDDEDWLVGARHYEGELAALAAKLSIERATLGPDA